MCGIKGQIHEGSNSLMDYIYNSLVDETHIDIYTLPKRYRLAARRLQKDCDNICIARGSGRCFGCKFDGVCGKLDDLVQSLDNLEELER